jgi:protein-disulfide isomerase
LNDGRTYGISGTPGFFIGNDQIGFIELKGAQPFESFKKVIDSQLKN